jgi:DnaJ homolog subfamily A member 2
MDPSKMCKACSGKKIKKESKTLTVEVDKGAPNGEKIVKHGEGDEVPDVEAGDVVVIVKEKKHKIFTRKGADLFMEKEISLYEALTGVDFILVHLDDRKVRIKNTPGNVIHPDSLFTVENLGMPFHKKTYQHGNLIIQFKIKFPTTVDAKTMTLLTSALGSADSKAKGGKGAGKGGKKEESKEDAAEVCELKAFDEGHRNTHHRGGTGGHDSEEEEDDEGHHGQRVGCQA